MDAYGKLYAIAVRYAFVLFKGTHSRNRLALYDDGCKTSRA